eukprot:1718276-Heterocapsa_arctica.AAC.1
MGGGRLAVELDATSSMSCCSCSRVFPSWSSPRCGSSWVLLSALPVLWSLPIASTDSCVSWALRPNSLWKPP